MSCSRTQHGDACGDRVLKSMPRDIKMQNKKAQNREAVQIISEMNVSFPYVPKKVQVDNDQETAQSERHSTLQTPRWENLNLQLGTYTKKTYRMPSEQLFPNRRPWPLSYQNSIVTNGHLNPILASSYLMKWHLSFQKRYDNLQ